MGRFTANRGFAKRDAARFPAMRVSIFFLFLRPQEQAWTAPTVIKASRLTFWRYRAPRSKPGRLAYSK
jgi:hypothetical protein